MDKLEKLRGSVRPMVTYLFSLLVAIMVYQGREIPELLRATWLVILVAWFGERLVMKLANFKTGGNNG